MSPDTFLQLEWSKTNVSTPAAQENIAIEFIYWFMILLNTCLLTAVFGFMMVIVLQLNESLTKIQPFLYFLFKDNRSETEKNTSSCFLSTFNVCNWHFSECNYIISMTYILEIITDVISMKKAHISSSILYKVNMPEFQ